MPRALEGALDVADGVARSRSPRPGDRCRSASSRAGSRRRAMQREQVEGRRVAPVQVLEHENERRLGGQRLDQLRHLAQHALARRAEQLALEASRSPASRSQGICTSQVGACRRSSETTPSAALRGRAGRGRRAPAGMARSCRTSRHIALARSRRADRPPRARGTPRRRGLADARLAGDEHDLPAAPPRRVEPHLQAIERGLAADEGRRASWPSGGRGPAPGHGAATRCRRPLGRSRGHLDLGDESIAQTVDGGDVPGRSGRIAEGLSDLADAHLQHGVADDRCWPHRLQQRLLRDELAGALGEALQHREGLRREADRFRATPPEAGVGHVETERRRSVLGLAGRNVFVTLSPDSSTPVSGLVSIGQPITWTRVVDRTAPLPTFRRRGRTSCSFKVDSLRSALYFSFRRTGRGCPGIYGVAITETLRLRHALCAEAAAC